MTLPSPARRNIAVFLPLLVLLLALAPRIWWWSQKQSLYGDELTSLSLTYCNPGWGSRTFEVNRAYTGAELRRLLYTDGGEGLQGLWTDLRSLYRDNEDASHASLYYMLLRCSLTGCSVTAPDAIARRASLINLPLFLISFAAIALMLRRLWPGRPWLQSGALAVAFLNPASISLTLLVREYALAECLFSLWGLWCVGERFHLRQPSTATASPSPRGLRWLGGVMVATGLLSTGYFNALFLGLTIVWLGWCAWQSGSLRKEWVPLAILPLAALLLSWGIYNGYFSFLTDVRTEEVSEKLQGQGWLANVLLSAKYGGKMAVCYVLTPVGSLMLLWLTARALRKRLWHRLFPLPPVTGLWLCSLCWIVAAIWLSPWKLTHYFSPAIPLFLALSTAICRPLLGNLPRTALSVVALGFIGCSWCRPLIEHLGTLQTDRWPQQAKQVICYGSNRYDEQPIVQLSPYLGDRQTCTIATTPGAVRQALQATRSDTLYIFGNIDSEALMSLPGYSGNQRFNGWMDRYTFVMH